MGGLLTIHHPVHVFSRQRWDQNRPPSPAPADPVACCVSSDQGRQARPRRDRRGQQRRERWTNGQQAPSASEDREVLTGETEERRAGWPPPAGGVLNQRRPPGLNGERRGSIRRHSPARCLIWAVATVPLSLRQQPPAAATSVLGRPAHPPSLAPTLMLAWH